jgi:hypothetical protein
MNGRSKEEKMKEATDMYHAARQTLKLDKAEEGAHPLHRFRDHVADLSHHVRDVLGHVHLPRREQVHGFSVPQTARLYESIGTYLGLSP